MHCCFRRCCCCRSCIGKRRYTNSDVVLRFNLFTSNNNNTAATAALQQYNKKRVRRHSWLLLLFLLLCLLFCVLLLYFLLFTFFFVRAAVAYGYHSVHFARPFREDVAGAVLHTQLSKVSTYTHTHTKKHAQAHTHSLTHTNTNTVIPVLLSAQSPRLASHSIGAERRRDGDVDVGGDWKIGIFSAALQRRFVVAAAVFVVSAFAIRFDNRFISVYLLSRVAFTYYYLILLRFATLRVLWHVER